MTAGIRVRHLRLRGAGRSYDVSFVDEDGAVRPFSVIAGQISTGKTSILQLIDYCLGASQHPTHPEIERRARTALLELEVKGDVVVVERPLGTYTKALVHHAPLDQLADTAHRIEEKILRPASDANSLSTFLLSACDLAGRQLKQAPTQDASAVDPLSFRDLGDLFFLPHRRLDNAELLHERHHPKRLKLRQTIDVIFGAHDDALVAANARLDLVKEALANLATEIETIVSFLSEQGIDEDHNLASQAQDAETGLSDARSELAKLEQSMAVETASADDLRRRYAEASDEVTEIVSMRRDRSTLLKRLGALRAQYADDLSKLRFAAEAGRLLDPLSLTKCPSCLQDLQTPAGPESGACGLCDQPLDVVDKSSAFDVSKEIRTTETKLRELGQSMDQIEAEMAELERKLEAAVTKRNDTRAELDSAVSARLAPFIAQRDVLSGRVSRAEQELAAVRRHQELFAGIDERRERFTDLHSEEERLRSRVQRLRDDGQDHAAVVTALSNRFGEILEDFRFPKLNDPYLDDAYMPWVRGMRYSEIGSAGASTLISLAWHLAILEEATAQEAAHPGLLMIDSPQKNLMSEDEPDFDGEQIADAIYSRLIAWSTGYGEGQQLIIVDNSPRPSAEPFVVIRFSGDPDRPPYGLIDDEVD